MHYHAEVWLSELKNVEAQIEKVMAPFDERLKIEEYSEDDERYWRNPKGFWDWYQIGGRWTGEHDNYDPYTDPQNIEVCQICNGTGFRNDYIGQEYRSKTPSYTCNGCGEITLTGEWEHGKQGLGLCYKWPTKFTSYSGDIIPVLGIENDLTCFTLVVKERVFQEEIWTGENFKKTEFDGNVLKQLNAMGIRNGYLVTVDYHY